MWWRRATACTACATWNEKYLREMDAHCATAIKEANADRGYGYALVHPVAFDGKVWCFAGGPMPKVYAWAGFESLEVKFEPSSSLLTLKFRTFMAGSGDPSYNTQLSAYARGVGSLDGYDDDECDF